MVHLLAAPKAHHRYLSACCSVPPMLHSASSAAAPHCSLCALCGRSTEQLLHCRYSGSDLKELAKAAANAPVSDFLRAESKQAMPTPRSMEEVSAHCYAADTHNDATRSSSTTRASEATSCPNGWDAA